MGFIDENAVWKVVELIEKSNHKTHVFGRTAYDDIIIGFKSGNRYVVLSISSDCSVEKILEVEVTGTGVDNLIGSVYANLTYELAFVEMKIEGKLDSV